VTETHRENMCVIRSGVKPFTNHYPISVWKALEAYQSEQKQLLEQQDGSHAPNSSPDNMMTGRDRLAAARKEGVASDDALSRSSCGTTNIVQAEVHQEDS